MNEEVSFIGLGKLGLPLATCFGKNKVNVLAIDKNEKVISDLKNQKAPFYEPDLQTNIDLASGNMNYTTSYDIIGETDITIILVNTPSKKKDGSFSNLYIEQSLESSCEILKKTRKKYHLFIISSTVMPGSIVDSFIPLIENITNWKINEKFGVCYIPDFVALGTVIKDFENPEIVVLGESDKKAGDLAEKLYSKILKNNPPIHRLTLPEAEIAKVSLNAYVTMKLSFANFLANICERVDNANVDNITNAIGEDKRISPYFFKGGLSFGGTCFPRDTWAFIKLSNKLGLDAVHIKATQEINENQDKHLFQFVNQFDKHKISVLGLSFKPNSPVLTESASIKLVQKLVEIGKEIYVYDPLCLEQVKDVFGDKIIYCDSAKECVRKTELSVVALQYEEFREISDDWTDKEEFILVDCWRYLDRSKFSKIKYYALGIKDSYGF
jgi:UDPglucose 6-dehydrogenase